MMFHNRLFDVSPVEVAAQLVESPVRKEFRIFSLKFPVMDTLGQKSIPNSVSIRDFFQH